MIAKVISESVKTSRLKNFFTTTVFDGLPFEFRIKMKQINHSDFFRKKAREICFLERHFCEQEAFEMAMVESVALYNFDKM